MRIETSKRFSIILSIISYVLLITALIICIISHVQISKLNESQFANLTDNYWAWISNSRHIETLKDYKEYMNIIYWFLYVLIFLLIYLVTYMLLNSLTFDFNVYSAHRDFIISTANSIEKITTKQDYDKVKVSIDRAYDIYTIDKDTYCLLMSLLSTKNNIE